MHNKKIHQNVGSKRLAFSFVEIIITISIIALLAVIWISSKQWYDENMRNSKIVSDIQTINNALTSFSEETKTLPMPGWNTNFYSIDTTYKHSYDDPETFWVYGSITENTLAKRYLDVLPLDPKTNSYYAYGKTKDGSEFEVASVQYINSYPISKVIWNYKAKQGPYNLIREYNWPNFVIDNSTVTFPYNPEELVLIVTDKNWVVYREWDTITTWPSEQKEIFFSDWSVSILEAGSEIILDKLNFKWKDNLNTFVKIWLTAGTIWTRATKLNEQSEFEIYTKDTIAAVRWTIFWVSLNSLWNTEVTVIEWIVDTYKISSELITEINVGSDKLPKKATIYYWDLYWVEETHSPTEITTPTFSTSTNVINNTEPEATNIDNYLNETVDPGVNSCLTFDIPWQTECIVTDNTLTADEYNLFAYAPYNSNGDLDMYNSDWSPITRSSWGTITFEDSNDNKWIKILNIPTWTNFLEYNLSELSLWDNFAIEMSVQNVWKTQTWNKFVFDNNSNWLIIWNISNWIITNVYYWGTNICNTISSCNLDLNTYWTFITITVINWEKIKITDGTNTKKYNITSSINNPEYIYVWSKSYKTFQINWVVDYFKIYKK